MAGSCGVSFLRRAMKGVRRHLVAWLLGGLCLYTLFFVSQYVVIRDKIVHSSELNDGTEHRRRDRHHAPASNVFLRHGPQSWGNVTGLKAHLRPHIEKLQKAMRQVNDSTMPWEGPEVNIQPGKCFSIVNATRKATIIINVMNTRLDNALISLFYLIRYTDLSLVQDIIIVGDAGVPNLYRDYYDLFPEYLPLFRLFVPLKRLTKTQARKFAAKFAHGDVLVFLDAQVIVTKAWLQHVMAAILKHPESIVQPVLIRNFSVLHDPRPPNVITKRELQLDLSLKDVDENISSQNASRQPIMNYEAFAIRKKVYEDLRELEEYSGLLDIESVVFSLKSWLCGGGIVLAKCANVILQSTSSMSSGIHRYVVKPNNNRGEAKRSRHLLFVASVWLGPFEPVYRCLFPTSRFPRVTYAEKKNAKLYKIFYSRLKCKNFTHFVNHAQPSLVKPQRHTNHLGALKLGDQELYVTSADAVNLTFVPKESLGKDTFSHIGTKLSFGKKCVTYLPNNKLTLKSCSGVNVNQKWSVTNGQIILHRNPHLCIVKQPTSNIPTVNFCGNTNVVSRFNFTLDFVQNCIV